MGEIENSLNESKKEKKELCGEKLHRECSSRQEFSEGSKDSLLHEKGSSAE